MVKSQSYVVKISQDIFVTGKYGQLFLLILKMLLWRNHTVYKYTYIHTHLYAKCAPQ